MCVCVCVFVRPAEVLSGCLCGGTAHTAPRVLLALAVIGTKTSEMRD